MTSVHHSFLAEQAHIPTTVRPPVIGQEKIDVCVHGSKKMNLELLGGKKPPPPVPPKPKIASKDLLEESGQNSSNGSVHSPKLSENLGRKGPLTAVEASPPHLGGTGTGSETSPRSYQPEGSVDLSPSCSESLPTTPSYLKWAESMQYLLDDGDGCTLFKYYLDQQALGHLLEFVLAVKGFKIQMGGEQCPDPDLQLRLIKTINKRYVNSLGKNIRSRIDCLSPEQRRALDVKITTKIGLDHNVFDGAYQTVVEHLESKCYPNFLTSEIYIEHVQSYQIHESDSLRYQSSTASSVSGQHPNKAPNNADDSGISGITTSEKVTTGDPSMIMSVSQNTMSSSSSSQLPSVTSPELGYTVSSSGSVSQLLPTVREDSELSIGPSPAASKEAASTGGARPKRFMSSSVSILSNVRQGLTTEAHPNVSMSSASYPYHAHSSNWNPVSRQDSELQSQSSGAVGGDTTDDNYSTFRGSVEVRPRPSRPDRRKPPAPPMMTKEVNKESTNQFIPRPKIPMEPGNIAHNPVKFAKQLIAKLQKLEAAKVTDTKLRGALDMNKTKSSVGGYDREDHDLESDQSILDEHVDRVFNEVKGHNVSSIGQFDSSRAMSASFHAGYRTLDSSRPRPSHFGPPATAATSHGHFRGGNGNPTMAGDLAYFPSQAGKASMMMSSSRSGVSKSFSDTDFGMHNPNAHNPNTGVRIPSASHMPYTVAPNTYQQIHAPNDRVSDWLKTTSIQAEPPGFAKTSPRGSGRHQKRTRSQDRFGLQQQQQQQQQVISPFVGPPQSTYGVPSSYVDLPNTTMVVNEASRRLARQTIVANQSLPINAPTEFTTARYTFPQSKDTTPFLVRIPGKPPIKLSDVIRHLPKKNIFRFYFKTEMDGEDVLQEETNEDEDVPMWKGSVVVQCHME